MELKAVSTDSLRLEHTDPKVFIQRNDNSVHLMVQCDVTPHQDVTDLDGVAPDVEGEYLQLVADLLCLS